MTQETFREYFFERVRRELSSAYAKHGRRPWTRHEFYGVMLEEVDEVWDAIRTDASDDALFGEMVQVAAMCVRFFETGFGGGVSEEESNPEVEPKEAAEAAQA